MKKIILLVGILAVILVGCYTTNAKLVATKDIHISSSQEENYGGSICTFHYEKDGYSKVASSVNSCIDDDFVTATQALKKEGIVGRSFETCPSNGNFRLYTINLGTKNVNGIDNLCYLLERNEVN